MARPETPEALLAVATPDAWFEAAVADLDTLLVDHAHCEKKAASTALHFMFRYPEHRELVSRMSRLAREELRHFEQVLKILEQRGSGFRYLSPSRYAGGLRDMLRTGEPQRLVDLLIIGAFIEARSCERFARLAPRLPAELGRFYRGLCESEARHFRVYLGLAERYAGAPVEARVADIGKREAELAVKPDSEFRFHSGLPPAA